MITVKLSFDYAGNPLRQTPGGSGQWGDWLFVSEEDDSQEYDYWVVYEQLNQPRTARTLPRNTVLVTAEPPSVKAYSSRFLAQFSTVIACTGEFCHPRVIFSHPAVPWQVHKNYDELKAIRKIQKDKLIAVVASSKEITAGHRRRLEFVKALRTHFGSRIDVFGRGFNEVEDKWDALAPYRYQVVIENSSFQNYWTEKLADTFLAHSFPFYYGCPNITDFFVPSSLAQLDITDPLQSIATIEHAIANDTYEKSFDQIEMAREMVLDKYNLFAVLASVCSTASRAESKVAITLQPEQRLTLDEIAEHIPVGESFFLVDDYPSDKHTIQGRQCLPFTERDGRYFGPPADDEHAVRELQMGRRRGVGFFALAWPALWWQQHYRGFFDHLYASANCVMKNERVILFDLRTSSIAGAPIAGIQDMALAIASVGV